jgi:predicted DNA-binding protein
MPNKKKSILLNLSNSTYQKLKKIAETKNTSLTELFRRIIEEYLEQVGE